MEPVETMTISEASKILHKRPAYLQIGLQQGRFTFGSAVKIGARWNYNIIRSKFMEYAGMDNSNIKLSIAKLTTPNYTAYRVPKNMLKIKLGKRCRCDLCDKDFHEIWLVANDGNTYCQDCLKIFETTVDGQMCDKWQIAHYDRLLSD